MYVVSNIRSNMLSTPQQANDALHCHDFLQSSYPHPASYSGFAPEIPSVHVAS